jgi:enoyl-CoA hydratase/carnithine racemase
MSEHVIVADDGAIRLVRMNRPAKKNALTGAMYDALTAALEGAAAASDIRCVVLAGGPDAFCAGADLQDFRDAAEHDGLRPQAMRFLHCVAQAGRPLVAAVRGVAVGIGTTMLLHCDYVVAADDARFATPFVHLGLVPEAGSSLLMPRLMGTRRAFELLVMGRPLDAAAAKAVGLVNAVVASADVETEAMKAAREIAALPAEAVATSRRLIRGSAADIVRRIDEEAEIYRTRLKSPEARAAFAAFFARRS